MATAPLRNAHVLGWLPTASPSALSTSLNAAANWWAHGFVADSGRTINTTRIYVGSVTGSLASGDITASLYDSSGTNGVPGSSIATGKLPSSTITAAGWYDFTGFSTALTAGQEYWIVLKNGNASPAANFPAIAYVRTHIPQWTMGSNNLRQGWGAATSTNSGSSWTGLGQTGTMRVGYSDGSYDGYMTRAIAIGGVGDGVYSTRESGVVFTSPANASLKVAGLAMLVWTKTGTPTGSPRLGLWTGGSPSLLAYTNSMPITAIQGNQWVYSYFSSVQTIPPSSIVRVTLGETTQSDASSNRWNNLEFTWDTDSNSVILLPWNGTCQKTYFDGSSWTDTALGTSLFGHALLLDSSGGEFGVLRSGGMGLYSGGSL